MSSAAKTLITELDSVLDSAPDGWRGTALRRITELYLSGAELYTAEQVAVFDDVMSRLLDESDRALLIELSGQLAWIDNAPVKVVTYLARHHDLAISGPILEHSIALPDKELAEIADTDRRDVTPLVKIAGRPYLGELVTDVILKRGGAALTRKILANLNARISEATFARLVTTVNGDRELAAALTAREDLPAELRPWLPQP
jgi:uncharacterized protein (DUF2336 family)